MGVTKRLPQSLNLASGRSVQFNRGDERDDTRKFDMLGYTGAPVETFWGPLIVDLVGMEIPQGSLAVLEQHDPSRRAGFADRIEKSPEGLKFGGELLDNETANGIARDAAGGFPFQSSIGFDIGEVKSLSNGESERINGREFSGPGTIATKSVLREVSMVALGADAGTSAAVFSRGAQMLFQDDEPMGPDGQEKGSEGAEGNGTKARRKIAQAEDLGYTHEDIGDATNRSASIIGQIKSGEIENPPQDFLDSIDALIAKGRKPGTENTDEEMSMTPQQFAKKHPGSIQAWKQEGANDARKQLGAMLAELPTRKAFAAERFAEGASVSEIKIAAKLAAELEEGAAASRKALEESEAKLAAAEAKLAKTQNGIAFSSSEDGDIETDDGTPDHELSDEDRKAKWEADPKLRKEFPSAGAFNAWARHEQRKLARA